jgi:hypothetical protein
MNGQVFFWIDPGQPIWPVTWSLDRVDDRIGFQNYACRGWCCHWCRDQCCACTQHKQFRVICCLIMDNKFIHAYDCEDDFPWFFPFDLFYIPTCFFFLFHSTYFNKKNYYSKVTSRNLHTYKEKKRRKRQVPCTQEMKTRWRNWTNIRIIYGTVFRIMNTLNNGWHSNPRKKKLYLNKLIDLISACLFCKYTFFINWFYFMLIFFSWMSFSERNLKSPTPFPRLEKNKIK